MRSSFEFFFFSFFTQMLYMPICYHTWGVTYAEQKSTFFFGFLRKYLSRHSCYHTWGCTYFGFSRFLGFLKNIFGKMQSRAEEVGTIMRRRIRHMPIWCCSWGGYICWGFFWKKYFREKAERKIFKVGFAENAERKIFKVGFVNFSENKK